MSVAFTVYSRASCHLCDQLVEDLRSLAGGDGVSIEVVDVDQDASLRDAYGWDVPVLVAEGEELCRHRLDRRRVEAWLRAARSGGPPARE